MPGATWFDGTRLNFAENLLRGAGHGPAIIARDERGRRREISWDQLRAEVARVADGLRTAGVVAGDRVAGFLPNLPEAIVAMLATTSLGATWSSCSPDFGIRGVLDRFGQIAPKVLFTADGYFYGGKTLDSLERIAGILASLPSVTCVVVVANVDPRPDLALLPTPCTTRSSAARMRRCASSGSRSTIRSTSCIRRARRACRSASCTARAARCCST